MRPTVFIVEDDLDTREMLARFLELEGFGVESAENGKLALERLGGGTNACVILLDLMMPVMDGEELCDVLREDPALADIPVLVVSADTAAAVKAERCRAAGVMMKPINGDALVARMEGIARDGRPRR